MSEQNIKEFGAKIQKLINKENLSEKETYDSFCEILENKQPDLQQGAFLAALVAKGETVDEIIGAWKAICDKDTVKVEIDKSEPIFENSGTGMDSLKTFNVSSAAAVVAAACGVKMVRHGARALTSSCGTVDILEAVGVDVECDAQLVGESIEKAGIGIFNGMSPKVHPGGLGRILSQIRFGSTLNIAASLANPVNPTHGLRGVYSYDLVEPVGNIMQSMGYRKGMVVYGQVEGLKGGMDELSICGTSAIYEFPKPNNQISSIHPKDVGLNICSFENIAATGCLETEKQRFISVLSGKDHQGCIDFTCLNAGAILYIAEKTESIKEGVKLAQKAIESGAAIEKLKSWVSLQNIDKTKGLALLEDLIG